ncbi:type II toxin-antitoxin system HicB family antitoxin [Roseospira navarrensis]|uniref:Toxin-antitoxin system HicB family antitoxin n=1 Tax=Roseospira navarrensis TaxID=140058 RepID=A0A7X1ZAS9_9PROT|nr:type II toxin-antitoxin system HicB family antitoxin [Roseospira navarrensis]MQX35013.1 toxin-antitoxin system HicB family antitoxin [Roseospira navarrensis]
MTAGLDHDGLSCKGYVGSLAYSAEDGVFHGRLEFIRDLVTYEGTDAASLRAAFEGAVDDYLALCAEEGRAPDTPFKGSFNVRPGPDLHRRAMLAARRKGISLNVLVRDALRAHLDREADR